MLFAVNHAIFLTNAILNIFVGLNNQTTMMIIKIVEW